MKNHLLRIGVVGVGLHGRHYVRLCAENDQLQLVGVSDKRASWGREVAGTYHSSFYEDPLDLVGNVDAVCIITPASTHFSIIESFLKEDIHVLVEKPLCTSTVEAKQLVSLARQKGVVLQVGYLERFNPSVTTVIKRIQEPRFFISERSGPFSWRASDVDIVLDHMVHDLDILTLIDSSPVTHIDAAGVGVLTDRYDIVQARLNFASG